MVAETHTAYDALTHLDVIDFILNALAEADQDSAESGKTLTLADCGFSSVLEIAELAELVGEEYGERTLAGVNLEEVDGSWTIDDFVSMVYPDLARR